MHKLQHILDNLETDFLNPDQVTQFSQLLTVYAQLQNAAAVEHIMEALVQVGGGYKREPLTRELAKVLSVQDRALARALREKESKAKEHRRLEREARQQQAQIAKQAREDRLFNQREDHLVRKENVAQTLLDAALHKRANQLREQVHKYTQSQVASSTGLQPVDCSVSQDAQ